VLTSLIDLTNTGEFEDAGSIRVSHAEYAGQDLLLRLDVALPEGDHEERSVLCRAPREHRILASEFADSVEVANDHVLIWPYSQPEVELYFNGSVQDSRMLIGALVLSHLRIVDEWFELSRFLNPGLFSGAVDPLRTGHGLLAKGPESIIDAYRAVLAEFGIRHSSPPPRDPCWWDGNSWHTEQERLHVLLVGQSYVVGPEFREAAP
jgi:hypothetical protein